MAPSKLRKVMGTVKDQTSIGIAKVVSTRAPDLDVAIVKATSHEEFPTDEKYVREILHLTSFSRGYVNACVAGLSKRLAKTHNWVVALKAVWLIHRLLRDGDPSFEHEVLYATRRGVRLLNLSDFRDDSHSNAWDYSVFVRTYAFYLDECLDCALSDKKQFDGRSSKVDTTGYNGYEHNNGDYGSNGYNSYRSGHNDYEAPRQDETQLENGPRVAIRDMKSEMVFDKTHCWQRLLERFFACRPTGMAKSNRLVQVALYLIVKESFQLYADICEGLAILLDRFFDMEYEFCVKVFDTYSRAAKQVDELASFYNLCKNMGVCRTSEYPEVQKVSEKLLETLEDFLREKSSSRTQRPKSPEPQPNKPQSPSIKSKEPEEDLNHMKALPAPGDDLENEPEGPQISNLKPEGDLINLDQATFTSEEQENKFALALFSSSAESITTNKWEALPSVDKESESRGRASAWDKQLGETGKAGWELALLESASNLSKQRSSMPGGFDHLVLEGLYDQAAAQQQYMSQLSAPGSASSVAVLNRHTSSVLALPAPFAQSGEDPFAASLNVAPPSYVQMSDMVKKQQLLVQEQQVWLQYEKDGMQGQHGIMKLYSNPYGKAAQNSYGITPYGMPHYGMGGYMQSYPTTY
ncbi:hypothetical protein SUGI_1162970 [Cryptomeria japonica]|uniref:putative clathrin assembly protein At2g25430 n=1 Tax=Cryptomeria japonica TaxID=3369 RepID=UPI002414A244|nr:putative clathrin assembly protein At2g25430 [Cryptomeria japonica]XP_057866138.1 putative clathrin assembly protein At2g25430 [Cryptomeria japonica]GLJ54227.1 hypothetical protein SUGI_1162970 [Cryptomeria japonica]